MSRGDGSAVAARVLTSVGTSIIVEVPLTRTVAALREAIARAHEEAEPELGASSVERLHGFSPLPGGDGIWTPINDTALAHEEFTTIMAQMTCANAGSEDVDFKALSSPAALRAYNRKALAHSPLLSPGVGLGAGAMVGVSSPALLGAGHLTPDYAQRRLNMGTTPAAAATPRAFGAAAELPNADVSGKKRT